MSYGAEERVSVIVPTYNRRERLLQTLTTLRLQSYDNLEIIVSDDGSTDGTQEAVLSIADERINYIGSTQNTGVVGARNRGIESASGQWVSFCDDDDFWVRGKIERQVEKLSTHGSRWCVSWAVNVEDNLKYHSRNEYTPSAQPHRQLWHRNRIPGGCSNVVVERSLLEQVGGFDPALRIYADWDMWLRLSMVSSPVAVISFDVLYVFHEGQMTGCPASLFDELLIFREKHVSSLWEIKHDRMLSWVSRHALQAGDVRTLLRVLIHAPRLVLKLPVLFLDRLRKADAENQPTAGTVSAIEDVRSLLAVRFPRSSEGV